MALTKDQRDGLKRALVRYNEFRPILQGAAESFLAAMQSDADLRPCIHLAKWRIKGEERLREKIIRKITGKSKVIDDKNVFAEVNDAVGLRLVHLHTAQVDVMNRAIIRVAKQERINVIEGPIGYCWDKEYEALYKKIGVKVVPRESMYSSIHYVFSMNKQNVVTFELQLRTLMDEVWGEVSHMVGYEDSGYSVGVQAQLRVLARLTTGGTRLVDSIFEAYQREGSG